MFKNKKGESTLSNEVKAVAAVAITVAIVLAIVVSVRGTFQANGVNCTTVNSSGCTAEYNSTDRFVTALGTYATYGTIIVLLGLGVYLMRRLSKF